MRYRNDKTCTYVRVDKGEEVLETVKAVCAREGIGGGFFQGIGACSRVVVSTWIPEKQDFIDHVYEGTIEMITLSGNVTRDGEGAPRLHVHGTFSMLGDDGEPRVFAGHVQSVEIGYTGEIVLVRSGFPIECMFDPAVGIDVWDLREEAKSEA